MEIKVLGTGCSRCKKLLETVQKMVKDNQLNADVEYVTDIMRIMEYDVLATPAIVVDGTVKVKGKVPSENELKKLLGL
ncbi:MAG: thioredoxin family protein [Prevotella sp.]|nr:thioredoxin family protein [Prevotella sp.]